MIITLSPAKSLDYETAPYTNQHTNPQFLDQSKELVSILKKKQPNEIAELMNVSDKIAKLNYERYQQWKIPFTARNAKQAIFAFNGAVYRGFDFPNYSEGQFKSLQKSVRIISGLYGLLRPLDLIQPYRLEMGTSLPNRKGKDLYAFWKETVTSAINKECKDILINVASKEYSEAIDFDRLKCKVITPVFKDYNKRSYRVIGLLAKKARGLFTNYVVKNDMKINDIKKFSERGYIFDEKASTDSEFVFLRKK